jgi:hypothetical protein
MSNYMYSEKRILAAIAQVGFPGVAPPSPEARKKRTLRVVASAIIFAIRMK